MPKRQQYKGTAAYYENKLTRVMERFGVADKDWNFGRDRFECWVQFRYKGELYRFDHSLEKAAANGADVKDGREVFAQLVLAMEDLVRIVERGIYDLQTWVAGMKFLPAPSLVPESLRALGFTEVPGSVEEIRARYRTLAKQLHPDAGGSHADFQALRENAERGIKFLEARKGATS